MDEFNRIAWERTRMLNMYPSQPRIQDFPKKQSGTRTVVHDFIVVSLVAGMLWLAGWYVFDYFQPARPAPVQEETRPDVTEQIRTLERMIAEAKQLNADLLALHKQLSK